MDHYPQKRWGLSPVFQADQPRGELVFNGNAIVETTINTHAPLFCGGSQCPVLFFFGEFTSFLSSFPAFLRWYDNITITSLKRSFILMIS
jgi:hypothetical protein